MTSTTIYKDTLIELKEAFRRNKLWLHLGWTDILQRYRGSIIGPFWITFSMVIFVGALSIVYTRLFHQNIQTFIPFLTAGILIWTFISTVTMESADVFINAKPLIESVRLPYFIYIFKLIWRNQIIFMHNFLVFVLVALLFKSHLSLYSLLFIPSFILFSVLFTNISIIVALMGTRFRDIPPVISSVMMVLFFVSPVTWQANMVGSNSLIIKLNPISYLMDLVRQPLLGLAPTALTWVVCLMMVAISGLIAFSLLAKFRKHIPFWI